MDVAGDLENNTDTDLNIGDDNSSSGGGGSMMTLVTEEKEKSSENFLHLQQHIEYSRAHEKKRATLPDNWHSVDCLTSVRNRIGDNSVAGGNHLELLDHYAKSVSREVHEVVLRQRRLGLDEYKNVGLSSQSFIIIRVG
jgi:hypothetical protein